MTNIKDKAGPTWPGAISMICIFSSAPHHESPGHAGKFLYDVDGKFAYSHYEKQPHLYDIDGKHRFKWEFIYTYMYIYIDIKIA